MQSIKSISCTASTPLDFDRVIAAIAERYPGTRVVQQDWYAERYALSLAVAKRLGYDETHPPVESLVRVWADKGVQRGFEVPIRDDLCLYARLDKTGGYFLCYNREFEPADVQPLIDLLKGFGLTLS